MNYTIKYMQNIVLLMIVALAYYQSMEQQLNQLKADTLKYQL